MVVSSCAVVHGLGVTPWLTVLLHQVLELDTLQTPCMLVQCSAENRHWHNHTCTHKHTSAAAAHTSQVACHSKHGRRRQKAMRFDNHNSRHCAHLGLGSDNFAELRVFVTCPYDSMICSQARQKSILRVQATACRHLCWCIQTVCSLILLSTREGGRVH